ncbi:hypothetical protein [Sporomusa termitida]|uniref:hypothetical protein n=1 Tax=Sporomusa termitida TaxID=2377 RepID=UPI0011868019|nr:hypothetical protein [Sporomusa termitida]
MYILAWIDNHARALLGIALAVIILLTGILIWDRAHPPVPITLESQEQAATPTGVERAANAAQVPLSPTQVAAIAQKIKEEKDKVPDAVVQTTGTKLEETIQAELKKSGGQFAVVTDPKHPASVPVLPSASAAPAKAEPIAPAAPVILNQYNIKAYPERLFQIGGSYQEVFAAYSWKVSVPKVPIIAPHGNIGYLGVYGHANLDRPEHSRIGIILTIPH